MYNVHPTSARRVDLLINQENIKRNLPKSGLCRQDRPQIIIFKKAKRPSKKTRKTMQN